MSEKTPAVEQAPTFSKDQLLRSQKYAKRRDLLDALLENGKEYTLEAVDSKIEKFMKGPVD